MVTCVCNGAYVYTLQGLFESIQHAERILHDFTVGVTDCLVPVLHLTMKISKCGASPRRPAD
jgi:hypothetical protein